MEKGMSEAEAEEEAVRQMGDPEVAGRDMGRLYSKVLDYKMLFFFWGMGIFGCLAFWASSDSWDTEPISLGLFDGMPETIFHIFGLTLLMFGLFWSGVEKWVNVGTFYAWAKNWHGGGIVNSAVNAHTWNYVLKSGAEGFFYGLSCCRCSAFPASGACID